jgi:hypothetical protein
MRVEDMFASFDGDDFEAVMTAAARSSEPAAAPAAVAKSLPNSSNSSLDSSDEPEDLYLAVSRRRAAAMAAEAANKQVPKPKRRKAPLGSQAGDAWMFPAPSNNPPAEPMQGLSLSVEQQYEAAQRALLPPLKNAAVEDFAASAPAGGLARQQPAGTGTTRAVVAAAAVAATQQDAKQQQLLQQQEVEVVMVQRPDAGDRPVSPAPHAAHAQPAGESQQLLVVKPTSRGGIAGLQAEAAAVGQARPAASAPEGMLGIAGVGAATVATQQRQPGEVWSYSSRVLSAAPVLLAPLAAATAEMAGALSAGGHVGSASLAEAAAEEAEARSRLPALPSSDDEEYEQERTAANVACDASNSSSSSSMTGGSCWAEASTVAGPMYDGVDVSNDAVTVRGAGPARRAVGTAALRRALCKLKCSVVASSDRPGSSSSY